MGFIPVGWALYWVSRSDDPNAPPFFTRMIDKYTEVQERWAKSNDLHVQMVERAGSDRVLFVNTKPQEYVNMKFPEYVLSHRHHSQNSKRRIRSLESRCKMRGLHAWMKAYHDWEMGIARLANSD
jgi:hypothetical protein